MKKYLVLVPLLVFLATVPLASAQETVVRIVPASYEAGPQPPVSNILLNITVENVTGMVGFEIYVFFNASVLQCTDIILPPDFVFAGQGYLETSKLIDNETGEVHYGVATMPLYKFNGSGVLCQLNFTGITTGVSNITIITPDMGLTFYTQLLDENAEEIPYTSYNGTVEVVPELTPLVVMLTLAAATAILLKTRKPLKIKT